MQLLFQNPTFRTVSHLDGKWLRFNRLPACRDSPPGNVV